MSHTELSTDILDKFTKILCVGFCAYVNLNLLGCFKEVKTMSIPTMFGIPNCDTLKKAKKWLTDAKVQFEFHDYRKQGLSKKWLTSVEQTLGWEKMLNKRGTTFRQLSDEQKNNLDKASALELMETHPAMIKRPILSHNDTYYVGFNAGMYAEIFSQ